MNKNKCNNLFKGNNNNMMSFSLSLQICYLRMINSWEGDLQFPHFQELSELLDLLPPEKEDIFKPTAFSTPSTPSPSASPKVHHKKLKKLGKIKGGRQSVELPTHSEDTTDRNALAALSLITPQVSKSQRYQQECFVRIGELYEENKPVLVVPLGYSAIESPGMLPEEKV